MYCRPVDVTSMHLPQSLHIMNCLDMVGECMQHCYLLDLIGAAGP